VVAALDEDAAVPSLVRLPQFWSRAWLHAYCATESPTVALMHAVYQNRHIWPGTVCSYLLMSGFVPFLHVQVKLREVESQSLPPGGTCPGPPHTSGQVFRSAWHQDDLKDEGTVDAGTEQHGRAVSFWADTKLEKAAAATRRVVVYSMVN